MAALVVVLLVLQLVARLYLAWWERRARSAPELPHLEEPPRPVAPRLTVALDRPVHLPPRRARRLVTHRRSRA